MIRGRLIHPQILEALATSGHFSKLLIADGNFPTASVANPLAKKVFLNFSPGVLSVTEILKVLVDVVPFQEASVMLPPEPQSIHQEYQEILPRGIAFQQLQREAFYEMIRSHQTSLIIASGDKRRFANLLLSIGVVRFDS